MSWILAVIAAAWGQQASEPTVPALDTKLYRPTFDSRSALWAESAGEIGHDGFMARSMIGYLREPVVFVLEDGDRVGVVGDAALVELVGGYRYDRFRVGLDVPIWMYASSQIAGGSSGLGNVGLDGRVTVLDHTEAPLGLAVSGRLNLPAASTGAPLGPTGLGGQLMAIATLTQDRVQVHGNVGQRFLPYTPLGDRAFGDELFFVLGGGYAFTDDLGVSVDLAGQANYAALRTGASKAPMELLVGGWSRLTDDLVARGGLGRGLTPGIGAPAAHALFMVSWEPAGPKDRDHDGIVDAEDACPDEPEDFDAYEDDDGCPDPSQVIRVRVVDADGNDLDDAVVNVEGGNDVFEGVSGLLVELHAGQYTFSALASDYLPAQAELSVPVDLHEVVLTLSPEVRLGVLDLVVVDVSEAPIADATWTVDGEPGPALAKGSVRYELEEGEYELVVRANGYHPAALAIRAVPGETTEARVVLNPARVAVVREQIEIHETIYFETAKAEIKPESFSLLDEVAELLLDRPDIERVRIEGHTDSRGSELYNQGLSERRAASVLEYLVKRGVEAERLYSVGYGESRPLDPREVPEAWERNRRVDFFIEREAGEAAE